MPDLLIRNVPQEDLDGLDKLAADMGISRAELVRRRLHQEAGLAKRRKVTLDDLERLAELTADAREPDFKWRAWGMSKPDDE